MKSQVFKLQETTIRKRERKRRRDSTCKIKLAVNNKSFKARASV